MTLEAFLFGILFTFPASLICSIAVFTCIFTIAGERMLERLRRNNERMRAN
jgi:hypothetical protein